MSEEMKAHYRGLLKEQLSKKGFTTVVKRKDKEGNKIDSSIWTTLDEERIDEIKKSCYKGGVKTPREAKITKLEKLKNSKKLLLMYYYKYIIGKKVEPLSENQQRILYKTRLVQKCNATPSTLEEVSKEDLQIALKAIIRYIRDADATEYLNVRKQLSRHSLSFMKDVFLGNEMDDKAKSLERIAKNTNLFSLDDVMVSAFEIRENIYEIYNNNHKEYSDSYRANITQVNIKVESASEYCDRLRKCFIGVAMAIYLHSTTRCAYSKDSGYEIIHIGIDNLVYDKEQKKWDLSHIKSDVISAIALILEQYYAEGDYSIWPDNNMKIPPEATAEIKQKIIETFANEMMEINPQLGTLQKFYRSTCIPEIHITNNFDWYCTKTPQNSLGIEEESISKWFSNDFDKYYKEYLKYIEENHGHVKKK